MNYEEMYLEESKQFNSVVKRFEKLQENDIVGAYRLSIDSLQAYNRWSKIKCDIKKDLKRGEMAEYNYKHCWGKKIREKYTELQIKLK